MKRKILIVLLALGTVGGYASACHHARWHRWQRQQAFERHIADVCIDAAHRAASK